MSTESPREGMTVAASGVSSVMRESETGRDSRNLFPTGDSGIETVGAHAWFGKHHAIEDISLRFPKNSVTGLIGPSGCGKSTLLRCVNALEPIQDGEIRIDGERITGRGVDVDALRQNVGKVFQSYNLFPHMTVLDNITLAPRKVLRESRASAEARATALLDRIGLAAKAAEYPDRLSGGQQQRVAIVRALAMSPRVLLLDEITSALDPELVGEVLAIVRELAREGMTMILATHEMSFAAEVANTVCFLEGGRIVETGPPAQIFREPREARTRAFLDRVIAAGRL